MFLLVIPPAGPADQTLAQGTPINDGGVGGLGAAQGALVLHLHCLRSFVVQTRVQINPGLVQSRRLRGEFPYLVVYKKDVPMELVRWRWRAVVGVLLLAALLFWAMITFLGPPERPRPSTFASAATSSSRLPRFPLEFPDISRPLQEAVQDLGSEPVAGQVVEGNPLVSSRARPEAGKAAKGTAPPKDPPAGAVLGSGTEPDLSSGGSTDSSDDPVKDADTGFENPSTFGPDEPEPDPEPSVLDRIRDRGGAGSGSNGANGSSQSSTDGVGSAAENSH